MTGGASAWPCERVGIAGLGLIGGSIARAIRSRWPAVQIDGADRPEVLATASALGVIDGGDWRDADFIVLAAPVPQILELIAELGRSASRAIVTDVGSTKRDVLAAAHRAGLSRFVGGHPMSGAAHTGLGFARADLFDGHKWLLAPGYGTAVADINVVSAFVRGWGAEPQTIDAEIHDRAMAYVSHVPQLLAVALMSAAGEAVGDAGLATGGPALMDMTRLASSPASVWSGILSSNADFIREALAAVAAHLPTEGVNLEDRHWVADEFAKAGHWRTRLIASRP